MKKNPEQALGSENQLITKLTLDSKRI